MSEPKKLNDGRYYVNIGYTTADSREQPKLMLGRDRAEAILRAAPIEKLWDHSIEIARIVSGEAPSWDETGLAIAKQIVAGDETVARSRIVGTTGVTSCRAGRGRRGPS